MDMLPKIYFSYEKGFETQRIEGYIDPEGRFVDSGVEIEEYREIKVYLESDDPIAYIEIESHEEGELIRIPAGEEVVLAKGGNSDVVLIPDEYPFRIITLQKTYEGFYTINAKNLTPESLLNLRMYLEQLLRGLSYDLMKKNVGLNKNTAEISASSIQIYKYISEKYNKLKHHLELIAANPISDVENVYRIQHGSKRPDGKSQRWLSKKGISKNPLPHVPMVVNEKHTRLTVNTLENQWVLYIIQYLLRSLRQLDASFTESVNHSQEQIDDKEKEKQEFVQQLFSIKGRFGFENREKQVKRSIDRLEKQIKSLKENQQKGSAIKQSIRHMMSAFVRVEEQPWMKEVYPHLKVKRRTIRLLKDPRYAFLHRFYQELTQMQRKNASFKESGIPYKKTWQLFEYYTVGLVIDVLKDLGYEWTEGWLADKNNPYMSIGDLPSGTTMKFEKNDHYIEFCYDKEIETNNKDKSYSRYIDENAIKPDIRLTIYNENHEIYSEEAGLVIDAKCRNHKYLISKHDPDVMDQLIAYRRLQYYDKHQVKVVTPVKEVIVLYPKQEGPRPVVTKFIDDSIAFLQIEPSSADKEEKPFGYDELKNRLERFLAQVQQEGAVV